MKTLEELEVIRNEMAGQVGLRDEKRHGTKIVVGMATCGISAGAREVLLAISQVLQKNQIDDAYVVQSGCIGICDYEPVVEVYKHDEKKVTYVNVDIKKALEIVEEHIIGGKILEEYTIK